MLTNQKHENGYFNDFHAEEKIAETESEESLEGEDAPIKIKEESKLLAGNPKAPIA